ncbi:MAG: replication-relaxation family protein [Tetrasphaera sp.]|nr:replication-relaxation family protein [Tetrasphaera sp.]
MVQIPDPIPIQSETALAAASAPTRQVVGPRKRAGIRARLEQRDQLVLALFGTHRYLTTHLIEGFCFTGQTPISAESAARETRRLLQRLAREGLVRRVTARRVGGIEAGSSVQVWSLTSAGHRLTGDHYRLPVALPLRWPDHPLPGT